MALVFRTRPDDPLPSELVGVGILPPSGAGGLDIARAATVMAELQGPGGMPLKGKELTSAARAWADRVGFDVIEVDDADLPALRVEGGGYPDLPPAELVSVAEAEGKTTERMLAEMAEEENAVAEAEAKAPKAPPKAEAKAEKGGDS